MPPTVTPGRPGRPDRGHGDECRRFRHRSIDASARFGRFPTIQQAFLVFIGAGNNSTTYNPVGLRFPGFSGYNFPAITTNGTQRVQAGFFLQMYDPAVGTPFTYPWYEIEVDGLDSLAWINSGTTSYPMGLPSSGLLRPNGGASLGMSLYGGITDYRIFTYGKNKASAQIATPSFPARLAP